MKKFTISILSMAVMILLVLTMNRSASADALPELQYLGEGPGTFETPLDNFIVKTSPFNFKFEFGPTYQAQRGERVWGSRGTDQAPPAEWDVTEDLGQVEGGCIFKYIGVDDDLDGRINEFRLDGQLVETVTQGLVFNGSFVIPRDGNLTFIARDSVGGYFSACDERVTPTATATTPATETSSPTETPTATMTVTPGPSATATLPPTVTATSEPSITATATTDFPPTATATATEQPPQVTATPVPPTATPLPTETRRPRDNACLRINFEVGGQEAVRGLYVVQEIGGRVLVSWFAENGWTDSGWFRDLDISHENVFVRVLYYSHADAAPIEMNILNPAPGTSFGWLSWGMCHALEVAWPDDMGKPAAAAGAAPHGEMFSQPAVVIPPVILPTSPAPNGAVSVVRLTR